VAGGVIAEIIAKEKIRKDKLSIVVIARGTNVSPYEMHPEAPIVRLLHDREPDIEKHRAVQLTSNDVRHSTFVLTMTGDHKRDVISRFCSPGDGVRSKIFTLGEFAGHPSRNVIDPFHSLNTPEEEEKYKATFAELEQLVPAALDRASNARRD
jgi:protein-tyrosine-phosphatase